MAHTAIHDRSRPQARPARGTSRRELEVIALRLFAEQGFEETTIDQIATEAGINKRSFFRYFDSKSSVLWSSFDEEVEALRKGAGRGLPGRAHHGGDPGGRGGGQPLPLRGHPGTAYPDEPDELLARAVRRRGGALRRLGAGGQRVRRAPRPACPRTRCTPWRWAGPRWPPAGRRTTVGVAPAGGDLTVYLDAALAPRWPPASRTVPSSRSQRPGCAAGTGTARDREGEGFVGSAGPSRSGVWRA